MGGKFSDQHFGGPSVNYGSQVNTGTDEYGNAPTDNSGINKMITSGLLDYNNENIKNIYGPALKEAIDKTKEKSKYSNDKCGCKTYCVYIVYINSGHNKRMQFGDPAQIGARTGLLSKGPELMADRLYQSELRRLDQDLRNIYGENERDYQDSDVNGYKECWPVN